ncbi:MAG: YbbR-like domain-containing protein [Candidatus Aminicenantes bacterium]|nr:MAG: YbbR-like domain-containing protein [Candidatus Aminicenantes bacterium]
MIRLFRRLFLRNWGLKLFSFIIALVLWLTLIPDDKIFDEKMLPVRLDVHNIPPGMALVEKPPPTLNVIIRAPKRLIDQFTSANVNAVLDLREARVDVQDYYLSTNMIRAPEGAEIKEVVPMQVRLKLERIVEEMLEVVPDIMGELAEGLGVAKIEVSPSRVRVRGPESKVNKDDRVRTTPVDISALTGPTEVEASLILPNPDVRLVTSRTTVMVRILIQEINQEETAEIKE